MAKEKSVQSVQNDWDGKWPRYDPHRGYLLCEPCWNHRHFEPAYIDNMGTKRPRSPNCMGDGCACGCRDKGPKRVKFTHEGRELIPMENALQIGPKS